MNPAGGNVKKEKAMRTTFEDREKKNKAPDPAGNTSGTAGSWEEYIRRAEEAERELFGDEAESAAEPGDPEETERAYEDLVARLKESGVYREDPPEGSSISGKEIPGRKVSAADERGRKKRSLGHVRLGRVAGIALLCGACVFAASMTSEANRDYFIKHVRYLAGDDTRILVYNDDTNDSDSMEENKAIQDIEEKLKIKMPEFYYRPYNFEFLDFDVNTSADNARLEYEYEGTIIAFCVNKENENTASNISSSHGENIETVYTFSEGIKVNIETVQDTQDEKPSYTAQWQRGQVYYFLSGKIELEEMKKIVEQMKF